MYVTKIPNRGAAPTTLLRESYREDGKVKNRTLANLSKVPQHAVQALQRALRGDALVSAADAFVIERSVHHGHVDAVMTATRNIGLDRLIATRRCKERDLVIAMIASRLAAPGSKLKTTRWIQTTSLAETLGVADASEDDLYQAMDWLVERQPAIEKRLAKRHLEDGGVVLYDLTSTWMEGSKCELAARGYSRDGKKGKPQVNFGMVTDEAGRPVSVSVYPGNTADPSTVQDQVTKLQEEYDLDLVVFVGDRGMVTQTRIDAFVEQGGVEWISALKSGALRRLHVEGSLQLGLFDEKNLFEFESPQFPGERLVACRNAELAVRRAHKRQSLMDATKKELDGIQRSVSAGRLAGKAEIGLRIGRVINKYKVAKLFKLDIESASFHYRVRSERVAAEAGLDGIYIVRTSLSAEVMSAEDAVRHYKRLARVEKSFRSMKTVDLNVRPVYHYAERRVRAHIFLCMLAYYVEWHLRQAWSSLLFANEVDTSSTRDAVAAAQPPPEARRKAARKKNADGFTVHSFRSLMGHLSTIVQNHCRRTNAAETESGWVMTTQPDALCRRALELLKTV